MDVNKKGRFSAGNTWQGAEVYSPLGRTQVAIARGSVAACSKVFMAEIHLVFQDLFMQTCMR